MSENDSKTAESTETEAVEVETTDWQAEAEKWKELSRKNETRAKDNAAAAKELEELKRQQMTEIEKAVDAAKQEGYNNAVKALSSRLVDAEFRAAAAGTSIDIDALLDGLDRSRFLTDEGEVESESIKAFVERIAPKEDATFKPDIGQGVRGSAAAAAMNPLEKQLREKLGISA